MIRYLTVLKGPKMFTMTNLFAGLSSSGKVLITVVEQTLFNPMTLRILKKGSKEPI